MTASGPARKKAIAAIATIDVVSASGSRKSVIDMGKGLLLDLHHFVFRATARCSLSPVGLVFVLAVVSLSGCTTRSSSTDAVEDSQISGRIRIAAGSELMPLMRQETQMFSTTYPKADFELSELPSPQAVAELFGGRADLIALPRLLAAAERSAASSAGIELEGYLVGRSALVAIVHESNPVQNVSRFELQRMLNGGLTRWSEIGGGDSRIVPVLPPLDGETSLSVAHQLLDSASIAVPTRVVTSDSAVVKSVRTDRHAIGFVDISALPAAGVRALKVAALDGLTYVRPDAETIYDGRYPLNRPIHLYMRTAGPRLAGGFITFVTSGDGQRLLHEAGFVPTAIPVRFVRRSPLQSSH